MYICVLSSIPEENDPPYDPSPHMNGFRWKHYQVHPENVEQQIRTLANQGVDVFINLCDGTPDDALSGIGLVKAMEKLNVAFTGAGSAFFDPSRQQMKTAARKSSVPTPGYAFVDDVSTLEKAV